MRILSDFLHALSCTKNGKNLVSHAFFPMKISQELTGMVVTKRTDLS